MRSKFRADIRDHLVLPFGTATKADITRIHLVHVAATGIRLESDVPLVYIDKSKRTPLTLAQFADVFPAKPSDYENREVDEQEGLVFIRDELKKYNPNMTKYEGWFLDYYFEHVKGYHFSDLIIAMEEKFKGSSYSAFLPIPEMQIYVADPLDDFAYEPNNNFRVDYGFWDGQRLIAVEIDGAEPAGYARDVRRDRMLRRGGVDVIHILNAEIEKHGERAIRNLLPFGFLGNRRTEIHSPFDSIPF